MTTVSTALAVYDAGILAEKQPKVRASLADRFLLLLAIVLAGYAIDGRGFAYIGLPPLFIGEITLAVGALVYLGISGWWQPATVWAALALVPLVGMGLLRTIPFISIYQMHALRDAVLWGYSAFGV